ncbi:MAG TPA: hypothetical protein VIC55_05650 [Gemmatimonadaceae bacterium]
MPQFEPGFLRRRWKRGAVAVVLLGYGIAGGCYAERLPAPLTDQEAALLEHPPLPYRVIVAPWDSAAAAQRRQDPDAYSRATFRWLQSSGAFASVPDGRGRRYGSRLRGLVDRRLLPHGGNTSADDPLAQRDPDDLHRHVLRGSGVVSAARVR